MKFSQFTNKINESVETADHIAEGSKNYLKEFAKKFSGTFQQTISVAMHRIDTELKKFGYTLGELDLSDISDDDEQDFMIFEFSTGIVVKNLFVTVGWDRVSGQQNTYTPEGSKLMYDVRVMFNDITPEEMDNILNAEESSSIIEEFDSEEGDYVVEEVTEEITEDVSEENLITVNVPFLIRVLEWAREEAHSDVEVHSLVEKMIDMSGEVLDMDSYVDIMGVDISEAKKSEDDNDDNTNHIIMSLRKASSLNGNFSVEFNDGKKVKVSADEANKAIEKFNRLQKPMDKEALQKKLAKSYDSFKETISESTDPNGSKSNQQLFDLYNKFNTKLKAGQKLSENDFQTFLDVNIEIIKRMQARDPFWKDKRATTDLAESTVYDLNESETFSKDVVAVDYDSGRVKKSFPAGTKKEDAFKFLKSNLGSVTLVYKDTQSEVEIPKDFNK